MMNVCFRYTSEQMFDVVARVDEYPKFVPWCRGVSIRVSFFKRYDLII